jgi:hypothetical protein
MTAANTLCVSNRTVPSLAAPRFVLALGVMVGAVGATALGAAIFVAMSGWGAQPLVPAALASLAFSAVMIGAGVYWLRKLRRNAAVSAQLPMASVSALAPRVQKIDVARSYELSFRIHGRSAQVQLTF